MPTFALEGHDFKDPKRFYPYTVGAAYVGLFGNQTSRASNVTAFFSDAATYFGLQEQTDWTADTYKTLLNVSSGSGQVAWIVGPTAPGASETTTFEITVDGKLTEIAVGSMASGDRAVISCSPMWAGNENTTANSIVWSSWTSFTVGKTTFDNQSTLTYLPSWGTVGNASLPTLRFENSLLIRAKHSTNITNSTATAYSAIAYRLEL